MIQVDKLSKRFGPLLAVDNVSFSVERGEVLGFLGPNGAGKSTTMKMITGFMSPSSGTVTVLGHDVQHNPLAVKKTIGYLPEGAPLYSDMTAEAFLHFIAEIRGFRGMEKLKRVEAAVASTCIESVMHKTIETLSKGFKRRVGLAQAILHDPEVLIMDEPTDGLDPNQKHEVRLLIKEMAKNKAIIVSTHILEEVEAVCTRAIIIAQGKLVFDGSPAELLAKSRYNNAVKLSVVTETPEAVSRRLEIQADVDRVEIQAQEEGRVEFLIFPKPGKHILKNISQEVRNADWMIDELRLEKGHLDEVFRTITSTAQEPKRIENT